jgi:hypothetical protein
VEQDGWQKGWVRAEHAPILLSTRCVLQRVVKKLEKERLAGGWLIGLGDERVYSRRRQQDRAPAAWET